jgi:hypothetical protein
MLMSKKTRLFTLVLVTLVVLVSWEPVFAGQKKREKKAASWPAVDLTPYSILYVEDVQVTDPKAGKRKNVAMLKSAPERIEGYLVATVEEGLFEEVRQSPMEPVSGAVALKVELTQYKPGSAFGRAMLAGVGSAHLDFKATLIDAATGERLTSFSGEKTWAWGGAYGMSRGIEELEQNLAVELALYLKRCKGADTPAAGGQVSQVDR